MVKTFFHLPTASKQPGLARSLQSMRAIPPLLAQAQGPSIWFYTAQNPAFYLYAQGSVAWFLSSTRVAVLLGCQKRHCVVTINETEPTAMAALPASSVGLRTSF